MKSSEKKVERSTIGGKEVTRRGFLKGVGSVGLGLAATSALDNVVSAQQKGPVKLSLWTFDNPQQRPWIHKRVKLFMEKTKGFKLTFSGFRLQT